MGTFLRQRNLPLSRSSALGGFVSEVDAHLATIKASMKIWVRWVTMHGIAMRPGSPRDGGKKERTVMAIGSVF